MRVGCWYLSSSFLCLERVCWRRFPALSFQERDPKRSVLCFTAPCASYVQLGAYFLNQHLFTTCSGGHSIFRPSQLASSYLELKSLLPLLVRPLPLIAPLPAHPMRARFYLLLAADVGVRYCEDGNLQSISDFKGYPNDIVEVGHARDREELVKHEVLLRPLRGQRK